MAIADSKANASATLEIVDERDRGVVDEMITCKHGKLRRDALFVLRDV